MKDKRFLIGILMICLLITGCGSGQQISKTENDIKSEEKSIQEYVQEEHSYKASKTVLISGKGIILKANLGIRGHVKYNRYVKISASIKNTDFDFSGWLRVILPTDDGNSMYQKEIVLEPGKEKNVTMYFPAKMNRNKMRISLHDKEGETICFQSVSVDLQYGTDKPFIGIYSKKQKQMGYLESVENQIIYMKKSDFTKDYKGLDILDVIIISDIDTKRLSTKQRNAVKSWVKRGGTLVVADSGKHKEMAAFQGDFLPGKVGEQKEINTCFGLDLDDMDVITDRIINEFEAKKAEKAKAFLQKNLSRNVYENWSEEIKNIQENPECLEKSGEIFNYLLQNFNEEEIKKNLSVIATEKEKMELLDYVYIPFMKKDYTEYIFEESEPLTRTYKDKPLIQKVKKGNGNVMVVGCSLELKKKNWEVTGLKLLSMVKENLSAQKKQQLLSEKNQDFTMNNYIYKNGLFATETNNLPNLKLYGGILFVYVLLIGPVYFWFFRRKGKASWLWLAIPITSLVFSVFIYLLGTSTRIHAPYVNYLSHLHLQKDREGDLNTWFRLVNHKNIGYEMKLEGNYDVEPFFAKQSYSADNDQPAKKITEAYQHGIEYTSKYTKIHFMNTDAFQGMDFKDYEIVESGGDVLTQIVSDDMTLQGTITNQFSYALDNCFLYDNGTIYLLGEIPAYQSISLSDIKSEKIILPSEYNYDYSELMLLMFSKENGTNFDRKRKEALAKGCLQEGNLTECFFFGFASDGEEEDNPFIHNFSLNHYGVTAISKDIELTYRSNGMEVIPDISEYAYMYDATETDGKMVLEKNERILVRYKLPKGYQWKGLAYSQNNNAEFSYFSNGYKGAAIFAGTATIYDRRIGREVKVLESGQEMNMELVEEYLGDNNEMTLYYYPDQEIDVELQLPTIMAYVTKNP